MLVQDNHPAYEETTGGSLVDWTYAQNKENPQKIQPTTIHKLFPGVHDAKGK